MELRQHKNERDVSVDEDRKKDEVEVRPQWPGKKPKTASREVDARTPDLKRIRAAIGALRGGGVALPGAMTREYSQLLGLDLSDVRIHRGGAAADAARSLDATAFTHGSDIAVADHLDLDSPFGRHVLAHELVHVAQNKRSGGGMELAAHAEVGPSGSAIEQEAERGAAALTRGMSFMVGAHSRLPSISRYGNDENPPTGAAVPVPVPGANPPPVDAPVRAAVPSPTAQPTQAQPAQTPPPPPPTPQAAPAPQPRPSDQPSATTTPVAPATPAAGTPGHNAPSGSAPAPDPTTPANRERPSPRPQPAPTPAVSLDEKVQQELEKRADPTLKANYAKAVAGVDSLRIQALQFSFTPNGIWNTLVETFTAKNAFQDHFGQIYSTNAYRGGNSWADTAQAWIEGLRGVVHIIGDVASVISAWAGLAALVTGALALILSETVIGGIALGAIAAIAAEVALVAGAIKLLTDIIDTLLGIIQMIILIVRARNSKDPAARARFAQLLHKEAADFGANVVSIGTQVAVMAVSAGIGAGLSRGANSFMSAFREEFSKMITPALKPWTLGNNFRSIANMARPIAPGRGVSTNGRTVLNVEVSQNLIGIQRLQRNALGRVTSTREIVPFTPANQMRGARLVTMRAAVGRAMAINGAGVKIGLGASQIQADIKQPRDFNRGGTASTSPSGGGGRINAASSAGADLSKLQMWPSQIEAFENAKGPLQGAVDRTQRQYDMAETQAGPELAAQVRTAFQGANNSAGQVRFGAMQVQADATEGQANTQRGLQQTTQARQGQDRMGQAQNTANTSVNRISNEGTKLQSPPPKEGVLGWLYNQTIGRIGAWIGSAQKWVTNLVGKWAMSLAGFSKEEMDIAGIENDMREDDKKDQNSSQEAQDAAIRADQIQQTVFQLQENKTRDEQYAIQGMADAQRFIMALEDADRQLAAAIQNGQGYIGQVTPIIRHELETEQNNNAIDAAYIAPITAAAVALDGSLDASNVASRAQQQATDALNQRKAAYAELDIGPASSAIAGSVGNYSTAFSTLVSGVRGQTAAMQTALQAFVGTQDYEGVHANAAALDALGADFDRAAQELSNQLYAGLNSTLTQVDQHIQRAIDEANQVADDEEAVPDAPAADPVPAAQVPPVQRKAITSAPVIAVQRKALTNAAAPQQMQQTATADQPAQVPTDINNPAPTAPPAPANTGDNANATTPAEAGSAASNTAAGAQVPGAAPNGATQSNPKDGLIGGASNTSDQPATATKAKPPNATPKQMTKAGGPDKAEGEVDNEATTNINAATAGTGAGSNGSDNASEPGPASTPLSTRSSAYQPAAEAAPATSSSSSAAASKKAAAAKQAAAKEDKAEAADAVASDATAASDDGPQMLSGSTIEDGWTEDEQRGAGSEKPQQEAGEDSSTESESESESSTSESSAGATDEPSISVSSTDDADESEPDESPGDGELQKPGHGIEPARTEPAESTGFAVQRKASGAAATSSPVEVATQATAGSGGALPYLDTIQSAFGHHDVSGIRSHSGSAAEAGAEALGARAFAVGDAVAFGASPDLHTAAHEAAHVVQQRAGLRPDGGSIDTGASDSLEKHADAVADAVVSGKSAQGLLDSLVGGVSSGASAAGGVQRKGAAPTVTSEAKMAEGASATRSTVGIGEDVTLTSTVAGTWTATAGTASGAENTAFNWKAPGKPGPAVIRVKTKDGEATKEFAVVAPSKVTFEKAGDFNPPRDNMMGAGMHLNMKLLAPNDAKVSFGNITVREKLGGASNLSGYFASVGKSGKEDLTHYPQLQDKDGKPNPDVQTYVNNDNTVTKQDHASLHDDEAKPWTRPFSVGSMSWQIPYLYTCGDATDVPFTIVTQTMSIVDSKVRVTITKGTASNSRTPTQPVWQPPSKDAAKKAESKEPAKAPPEKKASGITPGLKASASGSTGYAVGNADADQGYAVGDGQAAAGAPTPEAGAAAATADEIKTKVATPAMEANDDRKTVGVGEKVFFTTTASGTWTASAAGPGAKTTGKGKKYTWTAPSTATTATITFDNAGKKTPTDIQVIAPNGVDFWKRKEQDFPAGQQGAGMYTGVKFLPFTVSFVHTSWKEIAGGPSNMKGRFTKITPPSHKPNANWLHIDDANGGPTDHAAYWGVKGNPGWTTGSFEWAIPNRYKVDGDSGAGYEFSTVIQTMSIDDEQGTTTVTKVGPNASQTATVTRKVPPVPKKGKGKGKGKAKAKGEASVEQIENEADASEGESLGFGGIAIGGGATVVPTKAKREDKTAVLGDGSPLKPGMKCDELKAYVAKQADWFTQPSLAQADRDTIWKVLLLLEEGGMSSGLGNYLVSEIDKLPAADLTALKRYGAGFDSSAEALQLQTPAPTLADAVKTGKAIQELETFVPKAVMRVVLTEASLTYLTTNAKIPELKKYFTMFKPTLENPEEWPHIEKLLDEGVATYAALQPWVHDLHVFTKTGRTTLLTNIADTSRKLPVTLVLMSAMDWNTAFAQAQNLENAITNKATLTLVVQGPTSIAVATSEVNRVADAYGQRSITFNWDTWRVEYTKGKLKQVVIAGHGSDQSVEMASSGANPTVSGDKRTVGYSQDNVDSSNPKANGTELLIDTVLSRMDPKDANVVFAGCLVGSHNIPSTTNVSGGPAAAQASLQTALAAHPNLADYVRDRMKTKGVTGEVHAANGSTTFDAFNLDPVTGKGTLAVAADPAGDVPADPKISGTKLEYVQTGTEPEGAMRAAIECYADAKIGPTKTTDEMRKRVTALAGSTNWWEVMTRTGFEQALPAAGDVDPAMLLDTVHRLEAWFFCGWEVMINVDGLVGSLKNAQQATDVITAMLGTTRGTDDFLAVGARMAWMHFDPAQAAHMMTALEASSLTRSKLESLISRTEVDPKLATLLPPSATPKKSQLLLALTIAVTDGKAMPAAVRTFLRKAAGGKTTSTFPGGQNVPTLLQGEDELDVLRNIGLAPASAPSKGEKVPGNVNANNDKADFNETLVEVAPQEREVAAATANVYKQPNSKKGVLATVAAGAKLRVMGTTGKYSFIDHNGKRGFIETSTLKP